MRFCDIQRNSPKWIKQAQFYVYSVSESQETRYEGFCQTLEVEDGSGVKEVLNYFHTGGEMEIAPDFIGKQWLDVRFKEGYFQCIPAQAPAQVQLEDSGPDWNKINLGKCRHGILCAMIQGGQLRFIENGDGKNDLIIPEQTLRIINQLAYFSMTGEIHEEHLRTGDGEPRTPAQIAG
jgi:hypothetical protein